MPRTIRKSRAKDQPSRYSKSAPSRAIKSSSRSVAPAQAANLGETGQSGFECMPLPISQIDFPEQFLTGLRAERVRARTDNRHFAFEDVEKLGQLVDTSPAQERPNPGYTVIAHAGRTVAFLTAAREPH